NPVGCAPLALGAAPLTGTIDPAAETDCYIFASSANNRVRVRAVETSGTLLAILEVVRPDGTTLCGPSSAGELTCLLDSSGPHTLLVHDYYGTSSGSYNLHLQRLNNPVSCSALAFGAVPTTGTIGSAAESDCFTFTGSANDRLRVRAVETTGTWLA